LTARECVRSVTVCATQWAAGQAYEYGGQAHAGGFALQGIEYLGDAQLRHVTGVASRLREQLRCRSSRTNGFHPTVSKRQLRICIHVRHRLLGGSEQFLGFGGGFAARVLGNEFFERFARGIGSFQPIFAARNSVHHIC
jgi:hypothetical protein